MSILYLLDDKNYSPFCLNTLFRNMNLVDTCQLQKLHWKQKYLHMSSNGPILRIQTLNRQGNKIDYELRNYDSTFIYPATMDTLQYMFIAVLDYGLEPSKTYIHIKLPQIIQEFNLHKVLHFEFIDPIYEMQYLEQIYPFENFNIEISIKYHKPYTFFYSNSNFCCHHQTSSCFIDQN